MHNKVLFGLVLVSLALIANAQTSKLISNAFGSNMVLQRGSSVNIWGWTAVPNSQVTLTVDGKNGYSTTSKSDGAWTIAFPPPSASADPHTIVVASGSESATLSNVLIGDVFLCSGQSNMEFTVAQAFNASEAIKDANNYPHLRLFTVGQKTTSATPLSEFATIEQQWSVANANTVGLGAWTAFSAVCWFAGRDVFVNQLKASVPIGLISTNWGGTIIQAWSSPDALAKCIKEEADKPALYHNAAESLMRVGGQNDPSQLWNAMVVPLLGMKVTAAFWYQAESNVGQDALYACMFPAMIEDWRAKFQSELPFFFVQLAAYVASGNLPAMREAQTAALRLSKVGMATAIDLGDYTSTYGDIHPRDKQTVGARLALGVQNIVYGNKSVAYVGPWASKYTVLSENEVSVEFDGASVVSGLELITDPNPCPTAVFDKGQCGGFEIKASDGKWYNATKVSLASNSEIKVVATDLKGVKATGVRYAWQNWPVCTLYNKAGLPATPFQFQ